MANQHVNEIPLGNGAVMKEFFLVPGESAPVSEERDGALPQTDPLVKRYYAEPFVEFGGRRLPVVHEGTCPLSRITMETLEEPFEPGTRFRKAIHARKEVALQNLLKNGGHDGKNISVRDWNIAPKGVTLIGQSMHYTQFRATDAAQDEPLRPYDSSFPEGATLRDYVVVNGMESRKGTDILSNLLGAAFIVRATGRDQQDYFVLGRIRRSGMLSVVGGTPMWDEAYSASEKRVDFADYLQRLGRQEHEEELLLRPDEIEIGNDVYLVRTLLRVFDPFYTVDVDPVVTVEDIAARCFGNEEALKEHDRLYAVPRTKEAVQGVMNNQRGYAIHAGTIAGLALALQEEE